jgi:UDP-N-acetylglucosamine 2-epimerase (non-hydrolysing)
MPIGVALDARMRLVLVTVHRRDSFGQPLERICRAIRALHDLLPEIEFLWPVHPNPAVGPIVHDELRPCPRVKLCPPLPYGSFVSAMQRATLILTDSGGIQEEAPALGKPVLVLRNETERHEAVAAGVALLVGQDPDRIITEATRLVTDSDAYRSMATGASPYGDGRAGRRIAAIARRYLRGAESSRFSMAAASRSPGHPAISARQRSSASACSSRSRCTTSSRNHNAASSGSSES